MSWSQAIQHANDLATQATKLEASLPSLGPLVSPLPTLQKAFPLYVAAAQAYSQALDHADPSSTAERDGVKKKWALVLGRAEKVKARIEALGGVVPRAQVGDEREEASVVRRGGTIGGADVGVWLGDEGAERAYGDNSRVFKEEGPGAWVGRGVGVELSEEQERAGVHWVTVKEGDWSLAPRAKGEGGKQEETDENGRWLPVQGQGADCSVVAGLAACMTHNERWGTSLAISSLYPQTSDGRPTHSPNGKYLVRMTVNGAIRSVAVDSLLPYTTEGAPIGPSVRWFPAQSFAPNPSVADRPTTVSHSIAATATPRPITGTAVHPVPGPSVPLLAKAHFTLLPRGYATPGSSPAPDLYALTGWVPQRVDMRDLRREAAWKDLLEAWDGGRVLVTLGTGDGVHGPGEEAAGGTETDERENGAEDVGRRAKREGRRRPLVPRHAYAVLTLHEGRSLGTKGAAPEGARGGAGERWVEVYDPGQPNASARSTPTIRADVGPQTGAASSAKEPGLLDRLDTMTLGRGASHDAQPIDNDLEVSVREYPTTAWYTWDEVCSYFETLNLNWDPAPRPVRTSRHWTWPKPSEDAADALGGAGGSGRGETADSSASTPCYRLRLTPPPASPSALVSTGLARPAVAQTTAEGAADAWILLTQHRTSKTQQTDDIALHVVPDYTALSSAGPNPPSTSDGALRLDPGLSATGVEPSSPYSNAQHVFHRHVLPTSSSSAASSSSSSSLGAAASARPIDLLVFPLRDRGIGSLAFSLHVFAPRGWGVSLDRVRQSWAYEAAVRGEWRPSGLSMFPLGSGALATPDGEGAGWVGRLGGAAWGDESVQYRLEVGAPEPGRQTRTHASGGREQAGRGGAVRLELRGRGDTAWNIALCWPSTPHVQHQTSHGAPMPVDRLMTLSSDALIASSGPYRPRFATLLTTLPTAPGTYIVALSTYAPPSSAAAFTLTASSDLAVRLDPVPPFGAGMYQRAVSAVLSPDRARGRPVVAREGYAGNTAFDLIVGAGGGGARVIVRAVLLSLTPNRAVSSATATATASAAETQSLGSGPTPAPKPQAVAPPVPINLTLFRRGMGGALGDQVATSGPYDDSGGGVWLADGPGEGQGQSQGQGQRGIRLESGVYRGVLSCWDGGMGVGRRWTVRTYSDRAVELDLA